VGSHDVRLAPAGTRRLSGPALALARSIALLSILAATSPRLARGAGETPAAPLRLELIDTPTAQVLPRGSYDFSLRLLGDGAALLGTRVGIFDPFTIGFSYGGSNILGGGDPVWNPRIEFESKLRLFREGVMPGLAVGYNSQGLGKYDDDWDRYELKSRGAYAALGKTYTFLGYLAVHGGASISFEDGDRDNGPTLFGGIEKSLGDLVVFLAEYDIASNDNKMNGAYGRGRGYLNACFSWAVSEQLSLDVELRNLADNGELNESLGEWNREIRLRFMDFF